MRKHHPVTDVLFYILLAIAIIAFAMAAWALEVWIAKVVWNA